MSESESELAQIHGEDAGSDDSDGSMSVSGNDSRNGYEGDVICRFSQNIGRNAHTALPHALCFLFAALGDENDAILPPATSDRAKGSASLTRSLSSLSLLATPPEIEAAMAEAASSNDLDGPAAELWTLALDVVASAHALHSEDGPAWERVASDLMRFALPSGVGLQELAAAAQSIAALHGREASSDSSPSPFWSAFPQEDAIVGALVSAGWSQGAASTAAAPFCRAWSGEGEIPATHASLSNEELRIARGMLTFVIQRLPGHNKDGLLADLGHPGDDGVEGESATPGVALEAGVQQPDQGAASEDNAGHLRDDSAASATRIDADGANQFMAMMLGRRATLGREGGASAPETETSSDGSSSRSTSRSTSPASTAPILEAADNPKPEDGSAAATDNRISSAHVTRPTVAEMDNPASPSSSPQKKASHGTGPLVKQVFGKKAGRGQGGSGLLSSDDEQTDEWGMRASEAKALHEAILLNQAPAPVPVPQSETAQSAAARSRWQRGAKKASTLASVMKAPADPFVVDDPENAAFEDLRSAMLGFRRMGRTIRVKVGNWSSTEGGWTRRAVKDWELRAGRRKGGRGRRSRLRESIQRHQQRVRTELLTALMVVLVMIAGGVAIAFMMSTAADAALENTLVPLMRTASLNAQIEVESTLEMTRVAIDYSSSAYVRGEYRPEDAPAIVQQPEVLATDVSLINTVDSTHVQYLYFGRPDESFYGVRRLTATENYTSASGEIATHIIVVQNNLTNYCRYQYLTGNVSYPLRDETWLVSPPICTYRPTERGWYKQALTFNAYTWSDLYVGFTRSVMVTAAAPVRDPITGALLAVVGIDLFLDQFSASLQAKKARTLQDKDISFVLTETSGLLVAASSSAVIDDFRTNLQFINTCSYPDREIEESCGLVESATGSRSFVDFALKYPWSTNPSDAYLNISRNPLGIATTMKLVENPVVVGTSNDTNTTWVLTAVVPRDDVYGYVDALVNLTGYSYGAMVALMTLSWAMFAWFRAKGLLDSDHVGIHETDIQTLRLKQSKRSGQIATGLLAATLVAVGLLISVWFSASYGQVRATMEDLAVETSERVNSEIADLMTVPPDLLKVIIGSITDGHVPLGSHPNITGRMDAYFVNIIQAFPSPTSVYVGTGLNAFYGANRASDTETLVMRMDNSTEGCLSRFRLNSVPTADGFGGFVVQRNTSSRVSNSCPYVPTQRSWYVGAIATPATRTSVYWSSVYMFSSLRVPGITASFYFPPTLLRTGGVSPEGVVGIDYTLAEISSVVSRLREQFSEVVGRVAVVEGTGLVIGTSDGQSSKSVAEGCDLQRVNINEVGDTVLEHVASEVTRIAGPFSSISSRMALIIGTGSDVGEFFVIVQPVSDATGQLQWLSIVALETKSFYSNIDNQTSRALLVCGIILTTVLFVSTVFIAGPDGEEDAVMPGQVAKARKEAQERTSGKSSGKGSVEEERLEHEQDLLRGKIMNMRKRIGERMSARNRHEPQVSMLARCCTMFCPCVKVKPRKRAEVGFVRTDPSAKRQAEQDEVGSVARQIIRVSYSGSDQRSVQDVLNLQLAERKGLLRLYLFVTSKPYVWVVLSTIVLHMALVHWEVPPKGGAGLFGDGNTDSGSSNKWNVLLVDVAFMTLELLDWVLRLLCKGLVLMKTGRNGDSKFSIRWSAVGHILILVCMLADWIARAVLVDRPSVYPFIVPLGAVFRAILLINRSTTLKLALRVFTQTLRLSAEVFSAFVILLGTCTLVGLAMLQDAYTVPDWRRDEYFFEFKSAVLSTFAFISTGANFADLTYPVANAADRSWLFNLFFVPVAVLGTVVIAGLLIANFQRNYVRLHIREQIKARHRRRVGVVAAFMLLDDNGDNSLQPDEFLPAFKMRRDIYIIVPGVENGLELLDFISIVELLVKYFKDDGVPSPFMSMVENVRRACCHGARVERIRRFGARVTMSYTFRRVALVVTLVQGWLMAAKYAMGMHQDTADAIVVAIWVIHFVDVAATWGFVGSRYIVNADDIIQQTANRFQVALLAVVAAVAVVAAGSGCPVFFGDTGGTCAAWRAVQVLPILRVLVLMDSARLLVFGIVHTIPAFSDVLALLGVAVYLFAVVGVLAFKGVLQDLSIDVYTTPNLNFDSMKEAMTSLFQVLVGEGWTQVMYATSMMTTFLSTTYFVAYIVFVYMQVTNLVVGLLGDAYQSLCEVRDFVGVMAITTEHIQAVKLARVRTQEGGFGKSGAGLDGVDTFRVQVTQTAGNRLGDITITKTTL